MDLRLSRCRTGALLVCAALVAVLALGLAWQHRPGPQPDFEELLAAGGLWAVALGSLWLVAVAVALVVEACSGGSPVGPAAPAALRKVMTISAGVAFTSAALLAPTHAADPAPAAPGTSGLEGIRLPERSSGGVPIAPATEPLPAIAHPILVRPGDTLWAIARGSLPPNARQGAIAAAVRAWHRANFDVIGKDPDVLRPGQQLTPPEELS